jgi:hypothetical protein
MLVSPDGDFVAGTLLERAEFFGLSRSAERHSKPHTSGEQQQRTNATHPGRTALAAMRLEAGRLF